MIDSEIVDNFRKDIESAKEVKDYTKLFILHHSLIKKLLALKKYSEAYEQSLSILPFYTKVNDKKKEIETYIFIGDIATILSKYDAVLKYSQKALMLLKSSDDKLSQASIYKNIGWAYKQKGNYKQSSDALFSAYDLFLQNEKELNLLQNKKLKRKFAITIEHIGVLYGLLRDKEKSRDFFNKAYLKYKELNDPHGRSKILNNLGVSYSEEDPQKTLNYYKEALAIVTDHNLSLLLAPYLNNIGGFYEDTKDYDMALKYYKEAIEFSEKYQQKSYFCFIVKHTASVYIKKGQYKKALSCLEKSLKLSQELNMKDETKENFFLMSKAYENLGEYEQALKYLHRYSILKDEIFDENMSERLAYLEDKSQKNEKKLKEMQALKKQQIHLMHKSKLESLGQMASGIAHELNQPLGAISFGLDNIYFKFEQNKLSANYLKKKYKLIKHNLDRINGIIMQIRTFSQTQDFFKMENVNINKLIENILVLLKTQYKNHSIKLDIDLEENIGFTVGTKNQLEQVILNLLSNAKYAVEKKHEQLKHSNYKKQISIKTFSDESKIYIEIKDNGIGISQTDIHNIFDPFFTTKDVNHGTGLGLSISLGIIKKMDGFMEFESEINEYTRCTISLPEFKKMHD